MNEMVSFGAGVNSAAMVIEMVSLGWRGHIVFADPGAEHPDTYCWMDMFERDWLKQRGLEIVRVSPETYPDLYPPNYRRSLIEVCRAKGIVPIMFNRWCTTEYKRKPLTKWALEHDVDIQYLGIALDERRRAKYVERKGIALEYPLVDNGITRGGCKTIIRDAGLPVPPKSGCWFCPFQRRSQWRALYDLRPDLFDLAVALDDAAIEKCKGKYTHQLGENLGQKPLSLIRKMWDAQLTLPGIDDPHYEYQMCECRL